MLSLWFGKGVGQSDYTYQPRLVEFGPYSWDVVEDTSSRARKQSSLHGTRGHWRPYLLLTENSHAVTFHICISLTTTIPFSRGRARLVQKTNDRMNGAAGNSCMLRGAQKYIKRELLKEGRWNRSQENRAVALIEFGIGLLQPSSTI